MRRLEAGGELAVLTDRSGVVSDLRAWAHMVAVEVTTVHEGPAGWEIRLRRQPESRLAAGRVTGNRIAGINLPGE